MKGQIKFNTAKLLAESMLFNLSELGCYVRLATHYWVKGELPKDNLTLAKLSGCTLGEFKEVWPRVSDQFEANETGELTCPSLDYQRAAAKKKSETARASANIRWGKGEG
jgi:uncharacterized protein YdaU (DUF1376 family)